MVDLMPKIGTESLITLPDILTDKAIDKMLAFIVAEYGLQLDAGIVDGKEMVNKLGKVATRISRNIKRLFGVKLSNGVKTAVGNLAYKFCHNGGTYQLEFGDVMEMEEGEYKDDGSCFYGSNEHHREAMGDDGRYMAVLIRNEESEPMGRAWVYFFPVWSYEAKGGTVAIVFNAYGLKLRTITAVVGYFLNLPHRAARLESDIYINNGTCRALGENPKASYSLDIGVGEVCDGCGDRIYGDNGYHVFDETYCEDCHDARFFVCSECEETFHLDDQQGGGLCANCSERCALCGDVIYDYIGRDYDLELCRHCYLKGVFYCDKCNDYYYDIFESGICGICDHCFDKWCFKCPECEECQYIGNDGRCLCASCGVCSNCYGKGGLCVACHDKLIAGNEEMYWQWVMGGSTKAVIVYNGGLSL